LRARVSCISSFIENLAVQDNGLACGTRPLMRTKSSIILAQHEIGGRAVPKGT
jgi:hypothetical protein